LNFEVLCKRDVRSRYRDETETFETETTTLLKVIQGNYFGVKCDKKTKVGLITKVSSKALKSMFSITPLLFGGPSQKSTANIHINLILTETSVIGPYFCRAFSWWAPKDACVLKHCAKWPFEVIQGRWLWHQLKERMGLPIGPQSVWLITVSAASTRIGAEFDHIDTAKQGQGYKSTVSRC